MILWTVNWNQQPCVELLLKSYVKHHYKGEPLKLLLIDNGSTDGSKEWLTKNEIPFVDLPYNMGHENALNYSFNKVREKYALLCDTDVEFKGNVYGYLEHMNDTCISVGELIDKNFFEQTKIKDRISPWFWMMDMEEIKAAGIHTFRTKEDWTYDVGSEFWEKLHNLGYTNYNIERKNWNQDTSTVSMIYDTHDHIGKVSWDIATKHEDRYSEVMMRRFYIKERLKLYEDIDLKRKFI